MQISGTLVKMIKNADSKFDDYSILRIAYGLTETFFFINSTN